MALRKYKIPLHAVVAVPVVLIVLGALVLSTEAVIENIHFINATNQVLGIVSSVRMVATGQAGFAQTPGEDVWADLEHAGQVTQASSHPNPWNGEVRLSTVANGMMRVESDLPTHECRRLALSFLNLQPGELGLESIEAQSSKAATWIPIYPSPLVHEKAAGIACGNSTTARLALLFKIR